MQAPPALTAERLESKRLILEPLRVEHADELAPVLDDLKLHRFIGGAPADRRRSCEPASSASSPATHPRSATGG